MSPAMAHYSGLTDVDPFPGQDPAPSGPEQPTIPLSEDTWEQEAWWQELLDRAIAEVAAEKKEEETSK